VYFCVYVCVYNLPDSSSDSSSSDDDYDEYADEDTEEEGEEPLVRCKRPLCAMHCEFGFKKDSTGCPICECLGAAESSLIGRPDGHERPAPSCEDRPMCRMYCEFGFKRDADGCQFCSCLSDPCQVTFKLPSLLAIVLFAHVL